jgi:hypothetical protein
VLEAQPRARGLQSRPRRLLRCSRRLTSSMAIRGPAGLQVLPRRPQSPPRRRCALMRVLDLPVCGGEHGHRNRAPGVAGEELLVRLGGIRRPVGKDEHARRRVYAAELLRRQARAVRAGTLVDGADQGDAEGLHAVWPSTTRSPRTVAPWIASQRGPRPAPLSL